MTAITNLPDKWRNKSHGTCNLTDYCADDLESALPKWTKITNIDSLPNAYTHKFAVFYKLEKDRGYLYVYKTTSAIKIYAGWNEFATHWRPLCDLDYPPES